MPVEREVAHDPGRDPSGFRAIARRALLEDEDAVPGAGEAMRRDELVDAGPED
jgi:hypothetical protein